MPLSMPVLTVCAVFTFIWNWNNLLGPLLYLNNNNQFTIAIGLANMFQNSANGKTNLLFAANLLSMIPPAIVFLSIQKRLIGGGAPLSRQGGPGRARRQQVPDPPGHAPQDPPTMTAV